MKLTYEELERKVEILEIKSNLVDMLEIEIANNRQFLDILLDTIPNPVFYKDINGIYQKSNNAFSNDILGIPKEKIIGKSLFDLSEIIPHELAKLYEQKDIELFNNPGTQVYEGNVKCADGSLKTFYFYKATVENEYKDIIGLVGVMLDVTQLKLNQSILDQKNQILKKLSYVDSLTGVFNRRKFDEFFPERVRVPKRKNNVFNFAIIDVDSFKLYNDTYGHYAGDSVLKMISETIQKRLSRESDFLFRLGGEEFGLIFDSVDVESATFFADKIREEIAQLNIEHIKNGDYNVITISLGLVSMRNTLDDTKFIYEQADNLLYEAKESGKNRILCKVIA